MQVIVFIVKWLLPLYRILLSLSIIAAPSWYIDKFIDVSSDFAAMDSLVRAVAVMFIGCGILEHVVISLIHDNLLRLRWQYISSLFSSDIATLIFTSQLAIRHDLSWQFQSIVLSVTSVILCIRVVYVLYLRRISRIARTKYLTKGVTPNSSTDLELGTLRAHELDAIVLSPGPDIRLRRPTIAWSAESSESEMSATGLQLELQSKISSMGITRC
jgi:hypothetical protein